MATEAERRRFIKLSAAAESRGISTKTLRRRIASGELTGYRQGPRIIVVDVDELDALFEVIPSAKVG